MPDGNRGRHERDGSNPAKHFVIVGGAGGMDLWAARHWFAPLDDVSRVTLCDGGRLA